MLVAGMALAATAAEPEAPLTLKQAREIALRTHPKISVAALKAMIARKSVAEVRSGMLPNVWANVGASGADEKNTRIAVGGLTVSSVFDRASAGVTISQLVTDFGRTSNLLEGSRLRVKAEEEQVEATRAQIILEVDGAYFGALQAQSVLRVADQTMATRKLLRDQIKSLADNELRSSLDVKFAEVALQEARLLRSRADNDVESAYATLAALLGSREEEKRALVQEPPAEPVATNATSLIFYALQSRPELLRLRLEHDGLAKLARAEKAARYPTVNILASAGVMPARDPALNQNYAAAGVVLNVPIYSGDLYAARQEQAELRVRASAAALEDAENNVVRDVRIAWLNARNAWERLDITEQLVEQARESHALADARYKAGSSSIVELSQAELSQTSAEITQAGAKYEYFLRRSLLDFQTGKMP